MDPEPIQSVPSTYFVSASRISFRTSPKQNRSFHPSVSRPVASLLASHGRCHVIAPTKKNNTQQKRVLLLSFSRLERKKKNPKKASFVVCRGEIVRRRVILGVEQTIRYGTDALKGPESDQEGQERERLCRLMRRTCSQFQPCATRPLCCCCCCCVLCVCVKERERGKVMAFFLLHSALLYSIPLHSTLLYSICCYRYRPI